MRERQRKREKKEEEKTKENIGYDRFQWRRRMLGQQGKEREGKRWQGKARRTKRSEIKENWKEERTRRKE